MTSLSITRRLDSQGVVDRLHQQAQNALEASSLAFFEVELDENIAEATIDYLRKAKARGQRRFGELNLFLCPGNIHLTQVIKVALELDLFSKVYIQGTNDPSYAQPDLSVMGHHMSKTRNLCKLQMTFVTISRQDAVALKGGLGGMSRSTTTATPTTTPTPTTTTTSAACLEQLLLSNVSFQEGALEELCQAFRHNTSLETLALQSCGLTDSNMALVLQSLSLHPRLTTLRLFGNQCRAQGLHALLQWLSRADCQLEILDLHHQFIRRRNLEPATGNMRLEAFVRQGWPDDERAGNHSLRRLVLSGNKLVDDDMEHLSRLLRRLPCLEELDLDSNLITNQGLEVLTRQSSNSSRLRILRLSQNPAITPQEASTTLIRILRVHSELHIVTPIVAFLSHDTTREDVQHLLDINRAGRVLLLQQRRIPLSVWPSVLARLSNDQPTLTRGRHSNKNGMYYLLRHGPVLMEQRVISTTTKNNTTDESFTCAIKPASNGRKRTREEDFTSSGSTTSSKKDRATKTTRL
jgi:hypothetical protein